MVSSASQTLHVLVAEPASMHVGFLVVSHSEYACPVAGITSLPVVAAHPSESQWYDLLPSVVQVGSLSTVYSVENECSFLLTPLVSVYPHSEHSLC